MCYYREMLDKMNMKKQKIYFVCVFAFVVCLMGCGKVDNINENKKNNEKVPTRQIVFDKNKLNNEVEDCSNLKISIDNFDDVSLECSDVIEYKVNYKADTSMKEYDSEFREMFHALFPDHELDENYLFSCGGSSKLKYDDNTGDLLQDYRKVKDIKDDIFSGKEGNVYYLYDETWNRGVEQWEPYVCLELGNPLGYGYAVFNKGKTVSLNGSKVYNDMLKKEAYPTLESYDPADYLEYVATYSPESKEKYQLADIEIAICDAVKFFEEYINNLPCPKDKNAKTVVLNVDVYRVNDTIYGYNMLTTKQYNGVLFDHMRAGDYQGYSGFDDYSSLLGNAFMVESNDVDIVYGYYQKENMTKKMKQSEIISLENAIRCVSEKMTKHVLFDVKKFELVYTQKYKKTKEGYIDIENMSAEVKLAWKITLENSNDGMTYICYMDAKDGENFRYCVIPTKWWEEEQ